MRIGCGGEGLAENVVQHPGADGVPPHVDSRAKAISVGHEMRLLVIIVIQSKPRS